MILNNPQSPTFKKFRIYFWHPITDLFLYFSTATSLRNVHIRLMVRQERTFVWVKVIPKALLWNFVIVYQLLFAFIVYASCWKVGIFLIFEYGQYIVAVFLDLVMGFWGFFFFLIKGFNYFYVCFLKLKGNIAFSFSYFSINSCMTQILEKG